MWDFRLGCGVLGLGGSGLEGFGFEVYGFGFSLGFVRWLGVEASEWCSSGL